MKKLIIIFINLTVVSVCFADFAKIEEVRSGSISKVHTKSKDCEGLCVELPKGFNPDYHKLLKEMIDDVESPIYEAKSSVESCLDEEDCIAKESSLGCDTVNGYFSRRSQDNSETYCTKLLGYNKKESGFETVQVDQNLKDSFDSAELIRKQNDLALSSALARISQGKKVLALVLVRSSLKNLTIDQVKQLNLTYSNVKNLLETGSLESAKSEIEAITPDGVMITQDDKDSLLFELESFLSL